MERAVTYGWFVCVVCGVVAVCPGCVDVPDGVQVHLCIDHRSLSGVEGMATKTVWATRESAR